MGRMYDDLSTWWPLISPVEDYAEEAAFFLELFDAAGLPGDASLLEFGAGGGHNARYLKVRFGDALLTDLSPGMLEISRVVNPECAHAVGDMRTFDAGRGFDAVFIHDAIDYMTTLDDLGAVFRNAFRHCKPGGLVMLVPDQTRESYTAGTDHGGGDADGRSLRFLEWSHDPDPADNETLVEYAFVLREGEGPARVEHETHRCGLFSRRQWLKGLEAAGFEARSVVDPCGREVFLGRRR